MISQNRVPGRLFEAVRVLDFVKSLGPNGWVVDVVVVVAVVVLFFVVFAFCLFLSAVFALCFLLSAFCFSRASVFFVFLPPESWNPGSRLRL